MAILAKIYGMAASSQCPVVTASKEAMLFCSNTHESGFARPAGMGCGFSACDYQGMAESSRGGW